MQIVELEMVPLSLRPVLQRLYDMKTTQSALREGVLFSTKRNNYYYDTGTGKVIVLDDDTSYIFRVLFDPTLSAETFLISLTKVDPNAVNYLIATRLGIYDTPLSVILPGVFSAFPVFIMTRSFQDVPNELLEAAKLDGATAWQIFWKIGVPLGYAGIFAALVLNFIEGWNAVEQPLLFLKSQSNWPLSMYMNDIVTDNLGIAMAASLLSLIPAMLVFLYGQTYLELGIQAGGIKA